MTKLPEGRKPLPNEWFVDRAKKVQPDNEWPNVDDFSDINHSKDNKCVSCGNPTVNKDWCSFCLKEE